MDHYRRSSLNFFAAHAMDRATLRRLDRDWLAARLRDPATRIVPVWRSMSVLASGADGPRAVLLSPGDLDDGLLLREHAVLLGVAGGTAYFALSLPGGEAEAAGLVPEPAEFHELRDVGALLDEQEGALLAYARALTFWHDRHRFCGDCGSPTASADGGHLRVCSDAACGRRQFPRTDPAVIVLVTRRRAGAAPERCLMGRQPEWPPGLFSAVAGFVEPGESLEDAVVREVAEETGIRVGAVHYHSSQPWPFPSSLMLGFTAEAETEAIVRHDRELQDARWFTRADIAAGLRARTLRVPRRVSIAYRLVEDWFDAGGEGALSDLLAG